MSHTATCEIEVDIIRPLECQDGPIIQQESSSTQDAEPAGLSRTRTAVIITTLTGTTVVSSFSNGLVTVALPQMAKDVHLAPNLLLWPASVYPSVFPYSLFPEWMC